MFDVEVFLMLHKLNLEVKGTPEAEFAFTETMQSSLVAENSPLAAASILFCASFHSCSAPNYKKQDNY